MTTRISVQLLMGLPFLVGCPAEQLPISDPVDLAHMATDIEVSDTGLPELPDTNVAPWVMVTSPSPGTTIAAGESVKLVGQVSDDHDLPSELACTWISNLDGSLGQTVPLDAGLAQLVVHGLRVGQHSLTLEAIDSEGLRGSAQGVLQVNGPPTAPGVEIEPKEPSSHDDLVAALVGEPTDPNRPASSLVLEWRWTRDGVLVPDLIHDTVPSSRTLPSDVWEVRLRVFDGYAFSPEMTATATVMEQADDLP